MSHHIAKNFLVHISVFITLIVSVQCTKNNNITSPIENQDPLKISFMVTDTTTDDSKDGAITISVSGGVPPYSYLWSTGEIAKNIENCSVGTYIVYIEDAQKSTLTQSITVKSLTPPHSPLHILFVGNSLTGANDMPHTFETLASLNGKNIEVTNYLVYGPSFRAYYTNETFANILVEKQWDYVFLQSDDLVACEEYRAKELEALTYVKNKITANSKKTKILYFMCWTMPEGYFNYTYEELYQHILDGVKFVSQQYDFGIVPIGMAWHETTDTSRRNALYMTDGWHPTATGSYLYACVLYASLFKESVTNTPYNGDLSENDAQYFRELASETVLANRSLWNLD